MAIETVIPFEQPRKVPLTAAERQRACRARKKEAKAATSVPAIVATKLPRNVAPVPTTPKLHPNSPVTPVTLVTSPANPNGPFRRALTPRLDGSLVLTGTAVALAGIGMTMNGWFARSLGSSDVAGWLFLAIGVAADAVALAIPSCAARLWKTRQRGTAAVGWLVWLATFIFAVNAGIGFASVNISDVTLSRSSRVTPQVSQAQAALADVTAARDRECKGGVGKFCREREAAVVSSRQALEAAMRSVELQADPQGEAATKIVTWLSRGALAPTADDFAMLRLVLLALLPQGGGILLMIARGAR